MNIAKLFVAVLLATAVCSSAVPSFAAAPDSIPAAAPAVIKLGGVTGEVHIKTADGGTRIIKKGDPMPEIPAGAQIVVVSGKATVQSGGMTVKANAGDTFTVNAGATGGLTVAVTAGNVTVTDAKGVSKDVATGQSVSTAATTTTTEVAKPDGKTNEVVTVTVTIQVFATSTTQERAATTCVNTVSPSAPCN